MFWKLANIVGGEHYAFAARMGRDQHVVCFVRYAKVDPKCVAAFAENGNTSSLAMNCSTV